MAKLFVLSLAETNRNDNGYEVIARNLEENSWVIIPSLPRDLMFVNGKAAWDIFGITEVDLRSTASNRGGIYEVDRRSSLPRLISEPIKDNTKRIELLDHLAVESVNELKESPFWVGILKGVDIKDIIFRERYTENDDYDSSKTFFWECRLVFKDTYGQGWTYQTAPGVACKDMRFKAYWRDLFLQRRSNFHESKTKWLNHMNINQTYLLIEFIPNQHYGNIAVVSGVLCINQGDDLL